MQQEGDRLNDKLVYITRKIVQMIVKQFTCGEKLIKIAIPHYRQIGWDGINIIHIKMFVPLAGKYTHWHLHPECFMLT